ncbi:protein wech-like [Saccostrea cucullata]|uniref:protein wech-like n=1 Tax=Saccostrea cuccullata TaxID=36930 RepID=UPI002ED071DB
MENNDQKQSKVVRYSGNLEKQSIQFDDDGNPLFIFGGFPNFICENRNRDICVADCAAKAVVVVNQTGKFRFRYIGHAPAPKNKLFNPTGITTDSQGHILTADYDNYCVHIIDKDGHFLRFIKFQQNQPYRLCTDRDDNLFVAVKDLKSWPPGTVKQIRYLYRS